MDFLLPVFIVGVVCGLTWWWSGRILSEYEELRKANPPLTLVFKDRAHLARLQAFIDSLRDDGTPPSVDSH